MKTNILNLLLMLTMISIIMPSTIYAVDLSRDNSRKIVSDISTRLIWEDNTTVGKNWSDAITYCNTLTLGGYHNWRLPNIFELISLVDYSKNNPAIRGNVFQFTTSNDYWSATSLADDSSTAWAVSFSSGIMSHISKNDGLYIRCVI